MGRDRRPRPDRIISVIDELGADFVALQEVESIHGAGLDLLTQLAAKGGYKAIAGPTLLRDTGNYGNAVLTRLSVIDSVRLDISEAGREPRGALGLNVDVGSCRLQIVATHLGLNPSERRAQIRRLLRLFPKDSRHPAALLGDLNEWFLWGRPLRWLRAHFSPTPAPATFPARWPLFALDRIWVRPRASLCSLDTHKSPLARVASDHLPVCAVVEY